MSGKPTQVTDADFDEQVVKSDKLVLVDFWAPWCAPCRMVTPALEAIADRMKDTLRVCKVNVDESPGCTDLRYKVDSDPDAFQTRSGCLPNGGRTAAGRD